MIRSSWLILELIPGKYEEKPKIISCLGDKSKKGQVIILFTEEENWTTEIRL